jgi:putative flippase GtrA
MSSAEDGPQGPRERPTRVPPGERRDSYAVGPLHVPYVLVQFVKFGIVGISNTLITFVVYTVLLEVFDVWYIAASAIGFVVGATNGFLLNRRWTFADHVGDSLTPLRWGVVQTAGLGLNLGLLYLLVHDAGVDELVGQALATVAVTVSTFLVNRAWTFRHVPLADEPSQLTNL